MSRTLRLPALTLCALLGLIAAPRPVAAEPFPAPTSTTVNDVAQLLPDATEARIADQLAELRSRTGIEMAVLTLHRRADFDPSDSLEQFATRLFNGWGIGDAARDDGILILVLSDDREMRIELGAGYSPEYDIPAQDIVNRVMLPAFRDGRMADGIEAGTTATIRDIAERHAEGLPAPTRPAGQGPRGWMVALLGIAAIGVLWKRHDIWGALGSVARCPSCGRRGLQRSRKVTREPTRLDPGRGLRRQRCPGCGWHEDKDFSLPRLRATRSGGGSFGGGSSSGGGASGRW